MLDPLEALIREAQRINREFHRVARETYKYTRQHHADPKYEAFRDSEEGKAWKKKKLIELNYRCPECNKLLNDNNSSIDHKHPRRYYPWLAWDLSNLWVMCRSCNKDKSDKLWNDYLESVRAHRGTVAAARVLKYAPPAQPDAP